MHVYTLCKAYIKCWSSWVVPPCTLALPVDLIRPPTANWNAAEQHIMQPGAVLQDVMIAPLHVSQCQLSFCVCVVDLRYTCLHT